jgi:hypothetical protein
VDGAVVVEEEEEEEERESPEEKQRVRYGAIDLRHGEAGGSLKLLEVWCLAVYEGARVDGLIASCAWEGTTRCVFALKESMEVIEIFEKLLWL